MFYLWAFRASADADMIERWGAKITTLIHYERLV